MNLADAIRQLESMGTAQNRKVYARHGVHEPMFGVSYADLNALAKKIKRDHALAVGLWKSGNHDARVLATFIADPAELTPGQLEQWVADLDNYVLTDALSKLAAAMPDAAKLAEKFVKSSDEWPSALGWNLMGCVALSDADVADDFFVDKLNRIKQKIHSAKNRTRYAMNTAMISIGLRNPVLQEAAIETARRVGRVEVDHGETGCKTPDAVEYIKRAAARKSSLGRTSSKRAAKKSGSSNRTAPKKKKTKAAR